MAKPPPPQAPGTLVATRLELGVNITAFSRLQGLPRWSRQIARITRVGYTIYSVVRVIDHFNVLVALFCAPLTSCNVFSLCSRSFNPPQRGQRAEVGKPPDAEARMEAVAEVQEEGVNA
jgi:hypothetical protein